MNGDFPVDEIECTPLLVVSDIARARTFYRDTLGGDPDGHLLEILEGT